MSDDVMGYVVQFSDGTFLGTDCEHAPDRPVELFSYAAIYATSEHADMFARALDWEELSQAAMSWTIRPVYLGP